MRCILSLCVLLTSLPAAAWAADPPKPNLVIVLMDDMGYGDITPVSPPSASLPWMEAVFGQFYLAVVVATLVAMRMGPRRKETPPPPPETR